MILFNLALASIKKNKVRTLATILGIILSVSLLGGVIMLVFSASDYLTTVISNKAGTWHLSAAYQTADDRVKYENDGYTKEIGTLQSIGFANTAPHRNYLYIEGVDAEYLDMMPIEVIKGRFPVNSTEILLPQEYADIISLEIGDSISIDVGTRYSTDLEKNIGIDIANYTDDEILVNSQPHQYRVVGICTKLPSESGPAPIWYSAYTGIDATLSKESTFSYYFRFDNTESITAYYQNVLQKQQIPNSRNSEYLLVLGIGGTSEYRILIYAIGILLTILVVFGAVSLIHNSFAISIQQRIHELGILTSVGATYGQIKKMLLIEALGMCILGIPLGIAFTWGTVQAAAQIFGDTISSLFETSAAFHVKLSLPIFFFIVVISVVTVCLSATIPIRKLKKAAPIESIRQRTEPILTGNLSVSKRTQRVWGIKGVLAEKEYKANKKKYRSVIVTLAMSLVFFIGTLSIASYVDEIVREYFPSTSSDIYLYTYPGKVNYDDSKLMADLEALENVEIDAEAYCYGIPILLPQDVVSDSVLASAKKEQILVQDQYLAMTSIQFLEDKYFNEYLLEQGIDPVTFTSNPLCALAYDKVNFLDSATGQNVKTHIFKNQDRADIELKYIEGLGYENTQCFEDNQPQITVVDFVDTLPKGLDTGNSGYGDSLHLILPESARASLCILLDEYFNIEKIIACTAPNHSKAFENIKQIIERNDLPVEAVDYAEKYQGSTAIVSLIRLIAVIMVIVFMSIGLANLFNIMYASIMLRRKEFAVLQSVGMDEQELNQMLNLECFKYWRKSILGGTTISLLINGLLYFVASNSFDISFSFPIVGLLIAALVIAMCIFYIKNMIVRNIANISIIDAIR